jgi:hypothetical protein
MLKGSLIAFALSTLVIGFWMAPVMAQGVTVGYTLHVDFVYPYCWLYNLQVTFNDQSGRVVSTAMSLDGSELIVPIRMETPTITFTARAVGYASVGSYYFWPLRAVTPGYPGSDYFWRISGVSTILVPSSYSQNVGGDYWITIEMMKA